jgi:hypothetical protein
MKPISQMTDAEAAKYTSALTTAVSLMMPDQVTRFVLIVSDPGGRALYLGNADSGEMLGELRRGVQRLQERQGVKP